VRSQLAPVGGAPADVADSLAAHFADWGATSRFAAGRPADSDVPLDFEEQIKLFRERDRESMRFAFDLWSEADVSAHADAILAKLEQGAMPCDGARPAERVAVFRRWAAAPPDARLSHSS
jgi:hypothetical protein